MKDTIENAYATALSSTFKVVAPIKRSIIKTDCEVHLFIQDNALNILNINGYKEEYNFFKKYQSHINRGLVWADQDFKSYHHFYNPRLKKGKFGYDENAMSVAIGYYNRSLKYLDMQCYERAMFYFGACCHIVQDLTIPQHAKGKLLDNHRQFEVYVKDNYRKINRFKSKEAPVYFKNIEEYIDYNANFALDMDYMYSGVSDLTTRFYLIASKCITLSQRSTAGCMITYYQNLMYN
ncbi:MAG: zinc dependent phospholipase C family protein [Peptostreptococcaceae bacterium]